MLMIGVALSVAIPILLGLGLVLDRLAARATGVRIHPNAGEAGMMGFVLLWLLGAISHFFVPISEGVAVVAALAGLAAVSWHIGRGGWREAGAGTLVAAAIVIPTIAWISFHASLHYDTGLYHLQVIRWNQAGATPLGLANLHSRFGFNSSWLVIAAMIGLPGLSRMAVLLPGAIFSACFFLAVVDRIRTCPHPSWTRLFLINLIVMFSVVVVLRPPDALRLVGADALGSPGSDLPVALIVIYVSMLCLRLIESDEWRFAPLAVLLSAFSVSVKLSAAPILAAAAVVAFARGKGVSDRRSWGLVLAAGAVLIPWMFRGLLISGCFAYPIASSCVTSLPWAVSAEQPRRVASTIAAWARSPGLDDRASTSLSWFGDWWARFTSSGLAVLVAGLLGLGGLLWVAAFLVRRYGSPRDQWPLRYAPILVMIGINLAGMGFWFLSAPDPRFGLGYILSASLLVLTLGLGSLRETAVSQRAGGVLTIALLALGARLVCSVAVAHGSELFAPWPLLPPVGIRTASLATGQTVSLPAVQDQCWDVPLPCTPQNEFDSRLSMRTAGNRLMFERQRDGPPGGAPRFSEPVWTVRMGPSPWRPWAYVGGTWLAGCSESSPPRCSSGRFGLPGDVPLVGDWSASGRTDIAVFRSGTWFLDDGDWLWTGLEHDQMVTFGEPGDTPVVGNWSGLGRTQLGVFRGGTWVLDTNGNRRVDREDEQVRFGTVGDVPVTGNWSGEARTQVGVFRDGQWILDRNGNRRYDNATEDLVCGFGQAGDIPIVGDWNGTGVAKIGVFRAGLWLLDYNGNCRWDGPGFGDRMFYWGPPDARAGTGHW